MRKSFRLVLVAVLVLTGAGLVTPSALAALSGPAPAAATPLRGDDGDDDDGPPRVNGRANENHSSSDNGSGCFYPPSDRPKINLFDPAREDEKKKFRRGDTFTLEGKVKVGKCGIKGLALTLYSSPKAGERGWTSVAVATTGPSGSFTFGEMTFETTIFYKVMSEERYGFKVATSNIVKLEKKS